MINRAFILFCLSLFALSIAHAGNFYLQAIEAFSISEKMLQKSRKKIEQHQDITVQDQLEIPPFHKRDKWENKSLSRTFCTTCHLSPPHTKNLRSRTFLNMHTEFIACETCHLRPENITFDYQWLDYRKEQRVKPSPRLFKQTMNAKEQPKKGQKKIRTTDSLLKIAPFWENEAALIFRNHSFSEDTSTVWRSARVDEKIQQHAKIHAPLQEKGAKCQACHDKENSLLDLHALGANEMQLKRIQTHIIPQFFKRYSDDKQRIKINNLLR